MFAASSGALDRRAAQTASEQRRPLPGVRPGRRHEPAIRVDFAAVEGPTGDTGRKDGFPVEMPESFFRTSGGEPIRFNDIGLEDEVIADGELTIAPSAFAPFASPASRRSAATRLALVASMALHVLAAASLLAWMEDGALIAGGTLNEIAGIGNASTDQIASGDAINVTITTVPLVKAQPVETEVVPEAAGPKMPVSGETMEAEPAAEQPAEIVQAEAATRVEPTEQPVAAAKVSPASRTLEVAQPEANAAPVEPEPVASVSDAPKILAAPSLSDSASAPPTATMLTEAAPEHASQGASRPPEAIRAENAVPAEILPPEEEPRLAEQAPVPTPRPERIEKPVEKAEKHAPDAKKKAARAASRTSSGSGGRDSADAKRGVTEGKADGRAASSDDNSRPASAAGNAAMSNYPGKVVARLRRALRYPSEARSRRLNGTARVQFVVGRSGDVGSVRLAASSGSPVLDKAALATVQRAAPFPPIPEGAGRSSWTFTVPLAFVR